MSFKLPGRYTVNSTYDWEGSGQFGGEYPLDIAVKVPKMLGIRDAVERVFDVIFLRDERLYEKYKGSEREDIQRKIRMDFSQRLSPTWNATNCLELPFAIDAKIEDMPICLASGFSGESDTLLEGVWHALDRFERMFNSTLNAYTGGPVQQRHKALSAIAHAPDHQQFIDLGAVERQILDNAGVIYHIIDWQVMLDFYGNLEDGDVKPTQSYAMPITSETLVGRIFIPRDEHEWTQFRSAQVLYERP